MKRIALCVFAALLAVTSIAGVFEVVRTSARSYTTATSTTNMVFTNTFGGSFGWQLLAVDLWDWDAGATNTNFLVTVKVIPETDSYTNALVTLTNAIQGADMTITNGTGSLTYSPANGPILAESERIELKPTASNQTFKASIKYGVFMRQ